MLIMQRYPRCALYINGEKQRITSNMKRSTTISVVSIAVAIGIAGLIVAGSGKLKSRGNRLSNNNRTAETSANKNVNSEVVASDQVMIKNFEFKPKMIKIKKGTKVTWTNEDAAHHDITPDNESADFKAGPLFAKGESYSYTFNKVGSFAYHCSPHPYMKASIEVIE